MTEPLNILNFAYGSNMLSRRLLARVPSAKKKSIGILRGYELRWHKRSIDGSGKCDVVKVNNAAAYVYGVIYEIAGSEKNILDKAEGLGAGYGEIEIAIETQTGSVTAFLYFATDVDQTLEPYTWYKELVIAGAMENALPAEYVLMIERTPATIDSDDERSAKNLSLSRKEFSKPQENL